MHDVRKQSSPPFSSPDRAGPLVQLQLFSPDREMTPKLLSPVLSSLLASLAAYNLTGLFHPSLKFNRVSFKPPRLKPSLQPMALHFSMLKGFKNSLFFKNLCPLPFYCPFPSLASPSWIDWTWFTITSPSISFSTNSFYTLLPDKSS